MKSLKNFQKTSNKFIEFQFLKSKAHVKNLKGHSLEITTLSKNILNFKKIISLLFKYCSKKKQVWFIDSFKQESKSHGLHFSKDSLHNKKQNHLEKFNVTFKNARVNTDFINNHSGERRPDIIIILNGKVWANKNFLNFVKIPNVPIIELTDVGNIKNLKKKTYSIKTKDQNLNLFLLITLNSLLVKIKNRTDN